MLNFAGEESMKSVVSRIAESNGIFSSHLVEQCKLSLTTGLRNEEKKKLVNYLSGWILRTGEKSMIEFFLNKCS